MSDNEPDLRLEQELIIETTDRIAKRMIEGLTGLHEMAIAYLARAVEEEEDADDSEDDQG